MTPVGPSWIQVVDAVAKPVQSDALIPLDLSDAGEPRVNARDLHKFLESGWKFSDGVETRSRECDLVKGVDFGVWVSNSGSEKRGGYNVKDYWPTLDAAKEKAMLERNEQGTVRWGSFLEIFGQ